MKKYFILFLILLSPGMASGLTPSGYGKLEPASASATLEIPNGTVAQMEALASPQTGWVWEVTDGADSSDCDTGLGTAKSFCIFDGTNWVPNKNVINFLDLVPSNYWAAIKNYTSTDVMDAYIVTANALGKQVYYPPGLYIYSNQISMTLSGSAILGAGSGQTIFKTSTQNGITVGVFEWDGSTDNFSITPAIAVNGTYTRTGTTVTVTKTSHGLVAEQGVYLDFAPGGALDGKYSVVSAPTADTFTVTTSASGDIAESNVTYYPRHGANSSYSYNVRYYNSISGISLWSTHASKGTLGINLLGANGGFYKDIKFHGFTGGIEVNAYSSYNTFNDIWGEPRYNKDDNYLGWVTGDSIDYVIKVDGDFGTSADDYYLYNATYNIYNNIKGYAVKKGVIWLYGNTFGDIVINNVEGSGWNDATSTAAGILIEQTPETILYANKISINNIDQDCTSDAVVKFIGDEYTNVNVCNITTYSGGCVQMRVMRDDLTEGMPTSTAGQENVWCGEIINKMDILSDDTSPMLGGDLDVGSFGIINSITDGDIELTPNGNGSVVITPTGGYGYGLDITTVDTAARFTSNKDAVLGGGGVVFAKNDGAATQNNDRIGYFIYQSAYDGSGNTYNVSGVSSFAAETHSSGHGGSDLRFETTAVGATSRTTQMKIEEDGELILTNLSGATTGTVCADSTGKISKTSNLCTYTLGSGNDLNVNYNDLDNVDNIFSPTSESLTLATLSNQNIDITPNGSGVVNITGSSGISLNTTGSSVTQATFTGTTGGASGGGGVIMAANDGAAQGAADERLGFVLFQGRTGASTTNNSAGIAAYTSQVWRTSPDVDAGSYMTFEITQDGAASRTIALYVLSDTTIKIPNLAGVGNRHVCASSTGVLIICP